MSRADKPAFPINDENCSIRQRQGDPDFMQGMTLLEYATIKAMASICVNAGRNGYILDEAEPIAIGAVRIAKATIAELEKVSP